MHRSATPDVVVVGAGMVGAACAEALSAAGVRVLVIDRDGPAAGTTASGEGNVLVSDKEPGPELDLAVASRAEWDVVRGRLPEQVADIEWEAKGGVVVATGDPEPLTAFAAKQQEAGVAAQVITPAEVFDLEPLITRRVTIGVHYPDDAQVQPVLAATALLATVRERGGEVRSGVTALGVRQSRGRVVGVDTSDGDIACGAVLNACGPWAGAFGAAAGGGAPGVGLLGLPSGPTSSLAWATTSGADCACDVEVANCATVKAVVASSTMRRFVMMSLVPGKRLAATNSLSSTYWTTVNG